MRIPPSAVALFLAVSIPAAAQMSTPGTTPTSMPAEQLMTAPPTAERFTILSNSSTHGTSARWTNPDGTRMGRDSYLLRGQVFETDSSAHIGSDGMFDHVVVRGHTPYGDSAETLVIKQGVATWKSPADAGTLAYRSPTEYNPFGGTNDLAADFFEALLAAPDKSLAMLPSGRAHAEMLTSLTVGAGALQKKVTAYAVIGTSLSPLPVWVDDKGRFFASVDWLSSIQAGYEDSVPMLRKAQDEALASTSRRLAGTLAKTPTGPIALTDVRAFVDGQRFVDGETVVVDNGLITQVGPVGTIAVPKNALLIDGKGETLVPGLWDAHQHVPDDSAGPMLLSLGITSVRDPGNDNALTIARAARRARGELLMPHVYPSLLIDGKGPNTAQVGSVATSQEQALSIVRKAKLDGFIAIKIYGSFNPAWVKATAAEAHRLGLHVHGHLPAGMRPTDAIADGYDEITHIYFVMMQAMPDAVVTQSDTQARIDGPGRYAKDVDLDAEPMKSLIATIAQLKIVVDPTLVLCENLFVPENGDLSPAYLPYAATLPAAVGRGFRMGGIAIPADLKRADYRASFAKLKALVGALHKAGVTIVAGTDGNGMELVRELELYVDVGFTPSEALASATIAPARLVGADRRTGLIQVGKSADLVLVDGNPEVNISDLRNTKLVMMEGKLMDADALRAASGFAGRPKSVD